MLVVQVVTVGGNKGLTTVCCEQATCSNRAKAIGHHLPSSVSRTRLAKTDNASEPQSDRRQPPPIAPLMGRATVLCAR